jgi:hypothetical protein
MVIVSAGVLLVAARNAVQAFVTARGGSCCQARRNIPALEALILPAPKGDAADRECI